MKDQSFCEPDSALGPLFYVVCFSFFFLLSFLSFSLRRAVPHPILFETRFDSEMKFYISEIHIFAYLKWFSFHSFFNGSLEPFFKLNELNTSPIHGFQTHLLRNQ